MKTFKSITLIIIVLASLCRCTNSTQKDNVLLNVADSSQVKQNFDRTVNEVKSKESETNAKSNCSFNISRSYTDFWADQESGDMGGTAMIDFNKLADGNYEAKIEQRFGTEGSTYPKQTVNNLLIDEKGNISFEVKWFIDDFGDKTKSKLIKAKGTITKTILKFKTDIPNSSEYTLKVI